MAREIGLAIAMLVEAFNVKDITPVRIRIYEKALSAWQLSVVEPAVMRAIQTLTPKVKDWLPSIEQLNDCAEAVRLEMRAALVFEPCAECSKDGFVEHEMDGVKRMVRCRCWSMHQAKVNALDVGTKPLGLPPARERDFTQVGEIE